MFIVVLGLLTIAVRVGVLASTRSTALSAGIALAVATSLLGQDLGGLLTGHATDPPLVLFALTLWPHATRLMELSSTPTNVPGQENVGPKFR
ncbi:hypothetical protein [Streptomyces rishiriensis]|uniref:hypothetical protein n=1 Tax=Streptomyces rishiriensis TaxID=68264 RepID=UPI0037CD43D3